MMSCQSGGRRLCLSMLNDQLTCKLCSGYFIDATTIIECLHSFCRSCIVKYLESNQYCPICEVQVHESKPLINIRPDHTLQDIVYKLVPSCYQNEMRRRREFYEKHPEGRNANMSPEARGEPIESHIYSPDESLSLSLEYYSPNLKEEGGETVSKDGKAALPKRYLRCPAAVTVFHLQKLIRAKYGLTEAHRIDIMYKEEPLCSDYTLMDVMYIYHWRRKVPLHLSYRIFESSPKRIKLSEENEDYKQSLSNAGISSVETKEEHRNNHHQQKQTIKREWKEVQLKISETGVMSVTDISMSPETKSKSTKIEDETTTKKAAEKSKAEKPLEDDDEVDKSDIPLNQRIALQAAEKSSVKHEETKQTPAKKGANKKSRVVNSTEETSKLEVAKGGAKAKSSGEPSESQKTNVSQKTQEKSGSDESPEKPAKPSEEKPTSDSKKLLNNNNNNSNNNNNNSINSSNITDNQKGKTSGSGGGSKIDALSAKLQFQPKLGQVNNTYSKKTPKEKKNLAGLKKSEVKITEILKLDGKSTLDSLKVKSTRANCSNAVATTQTTTVSTTAATTNSKSSTSTSQSKGDSGTSSSSSAKEAKPNLGQSTSSTVERKVNPPAETIVNEVNERKSVPTSSSSKLPFSRNNGVPFCPTGTDNLASIGLTVSAAMLNMAQASSISSFPYTVHDLVNTNSLLRLPTSKASKTSSAAKQQQGNQASTSTIGGASSSSSSSSLAQINLQTPSMSIYSISTSSSKPNPYANTTTTVTATTAAATTGQSTSNNSKQTAKGSMEISNAYSVPPCPDAIPISLMKPTVRKHEIIAKGTNLNEICAKIGTSGSKINDICAKIGESTKEKNRIESRNRTDIPDLLKITKKSHPTESLLKHIPNIPNVPIYTPSSSLSIDKSTYSIKDKANSSASSSPIMSTTTATSGGPSLPKNQTLKKQTPMGYKTLRDPPKSWNPTLSKNNYVAVKNQNKELLQTPSTSDNLKTIPSKPAKIFKMRNVPRYLGNPASGVKPMYGVSNESKEKDQGANSSGSGNNGNLNSSKNSTSLMMKIDPKTLSPIVSTSSVNSPIVSPPPYSPNRNYQNAPPSFPRDICRNNVVGSSSGGAPISPRNSPVNMLSTNPFIPSPTPNTNPRLIYSHFPPPFPDPSAFPNPLIRSPIGIPPPSAFHSSLPPSVNKLYQRTSYNIPQTTNYSTVTTATTPPSVQRVPPSTHSSSTSTSTSSSSSSSLSSSSTSTSTTTTTTSSSTSTSISSSTATSISVSSSTAPVTASSSSSSSSSSAVVPSPTVSKSETTPTSKVETVALQLSTKQEPKEAFNLSNKSERNSVSDLSSKSTNNPVTGTSGTSTSTVTSTTVASSNVTVTSTSAATTTSTPAASPKKTSSPVKSKEANKKDEKVGEEKKEPEASKKVKDEGGTPKEEKKEPEKEKKEDKEVKSSAVPPITDVKVTEANGEVDKEKVDTENQKVDEKKEKDKDKEKTKVEEKDTSSPVEKKSLVETNKVSEKIEVQSNDRKIEDDIGKANEQTIGKKNEVRNKAES